jgi:hypothetical protein
MSRTEDRMPIKDHRFSDVVAGLREGSGLKSVTDVQWQIERLRAAA